MLSSCQDSLELKNSDNRLKCDAIIVAKLDLCILLTFAMITIASNAILLNWQSLSHAHVEKFIN